MSEEPSAPPAPPPPEGRNGKGCFTKGNKLGKGNPFARKAQKIRAELFKAITPEQIREAANNLVEQAKNGDLRAFAELLDRTIGKPTTVDLESRLLAIEEFIQQQQQDQRGDASASETD